MQANHPNAPELGLGTSRLRSTTGLGRREADELLSRAIALGIRFFDTASSYGQGDAERSLNRLRSSGEGLAAIRICTKAGYMKRDKEWLLRVLKPALRGYRRFRKSRSTLGENVASSVRHGGAIGGFHLSKDFSPEAIEASLARSLSRMQRTHLDVLLLHEPFPKVFGDTKLLEALSRWKSEGRIGAWGLGTSHPETIQAALDGAEPDVLQTGVNVTSIKNIQSILDQCDRRGIRVIANEVFAGIETSSSGITDAYRLVLSQKAVSVVLTGTTSIRHLEANVEAFIAAGGRLPGIFA